MNRGETLVVVPTYNECENLEELLGQIRLHVPAADVLIVDDGSPDGTAEAARALGERLGGVDVLQRGRRLGLGSAYREGFRRGLERGQKRARRPTGVGHAAGVQERMAVGGGRQRVERATRIALDVLLGIEPVGDRRDLAVEAGAQVGRDWLSHRHEGIGAAGDEALEASVELAL